MNERPPEDYTARPEGRAYVQTNFNRRGDVRGYSVYNPQGRLIKRYEARAYVSKRLCFELASGLRDSLNALLEQADRQPEEPFVCPGKS